MFDTGETARCHVLRLFACLKVDQTLEEVWEAFQKAVCHTSNRDSNCRTPLMAAIVQI